MSEHTILIEGLKVSYSTEGNGDDIILLHGWACNKDIFNSFLDRLALHFRVCSIDLPGFGQSDPPPTAWGVEEYTSMLEKFVAELDIKNPVLLGHSFGGRISILFASRNSVNKVLLVDSAGIRPRRTLRYHIKVCSFKAMKRLLPLLMGRKRANERIEAYRKRAGSSDYKAAEGIMRNVLIKTVNEDLRYAMPRIKAPTLLVWGVNDTATPLADAETMKRLIPDSGLVKLRGGHYSFLDDPATFRAVLDSFLGIKPEG
jgi:pimeloyl-ACP methyl ester carboxylesterase